MQKNLPAIMTVGALEPRGRAGILADSITLRHLEFQPITVAAGVILGKEDIEAIAATLLHRQLASLISTVKVAAAKTGLLANRENIETVATFFEDNHHYIENFVVDAVIESHTEMMLMTNSAVSLLKMRLLPLARVVVVYLSEAERLAGEPVKSITEMQEAAAAIKIFGPKNVLVRADHLIDDELVDILYDGNRQQLLFNKTKNKQNLRARRDYFSAAMAAYLARGVSVPDAARAAQEINII